MSIEVNSADFESEVIKSDIPVLVDFWAAWCMPCRMVAPVLEEIAKDYEGRVKVVKVNVDDAGDVAQRYGIMSIPTIILFKKGVVAAKVVGAVQKKNFAEMIDKNI